MTMPAAPVISPLVLTEADHERAARLRRMKLVALSLLAIAAVVYLANDPDRGHP